MRDSFRPPIRRPIECCSIEQARCRPDRFALRAGISRPDRRPRRRAIAVVVGQQQDGACCWGGDDHTGRCTGAHAPPLHRGRSCHVVYSPGRFAAVGMMEAGCTVYYRAARFMMQESAGQPRAVGTPLGMGPTPHSGLNVSSMLAMTYPAALWALTPISLSRAGKEGILEGVRMRLRDAQFSSPPRMAGRRSGGGVCRITHAVTAM